MIKLIHKERQEITKGKIVCFDRYIVCGSGKIYFQHIDKTFIL